MVCSPDLLGLRQERQDSLKYQELKFPAAKIGLILNRSDVPEALNPKDLEQALPGHPVLASIPHDFRVTESLNANRELVGLFPNSPFAKAVKDLARRVLETGPAIAPGLPVVGENTVTPAVGVAPAKVDHVRVKERIHALLLENPELKAIASEPARTEAGHALLREKVEAVVTGLMAMEAAELTDREEREQRVREIVDEALGLGPLEDLIRDPEVTEIMVNSRDRIYVERKGKLTLTPKHFLSDKQLMTVIERIVAPLGRRIDESQPYVDARLADGSRVNAIIPPLALKGPCLTIRKFSKQRLTVQDLIKFGSLNPDMADFLGACVAGRKNIVISGGTGSGKTTLLNIVASYIPEDERIVTVEDAAELNLPQPHVVTLEARPANIEGKGAITIRELVKNCLRMRPDRIVVGECRGGEALDMLQAMNTGHATLSTIHAGTVQEAVNRLTHDPINVPPVMFQALDLVVVQSIYTLGKRRIRRNMSIHEIEVAADGTVTPVPLFEWDILSDTFVTLHERSRVMDEIGAHYGWSKEDLARELEKREKFFAEALKKPDTWTIQELANAIHGTGE